MSNQSMIGILSVLSISLGTVFVPALSGMEATTFLGLSNQFWGGFLGGVGIVGCVATIVLSLSQRYRANEDN